jgi:hypothetical protein
LSENALPEQNTIAKKKVQFAQIVQRSGRSKDLWLLDQFDFVAPGKNNLKLKTKHIFFQTKFFLFFFCICRKGRERRKWEKEGKRGGLIQNEVQRVRQKEGGQESKRQSEGGKEKRRERERERERRGRERVWGREREGEGGRREREIYDLGEVSWIHGLSKLGGRGGEREGEWVYLPQHTLPKWCPTLKKLF